MVVVLRSVNTFINKRICARVFHAHTHNVHVTLGFDIRKMQCETLAVTVQ